jgi:hypothetical protein
MDRRDFSKILPPRIAAILDWMACICLPISVALGINWLFWEDALPLPGWGCSVVVAEPARSSDCAVKRGWHTELDANAGGRVAIRDSSLTEQERQLDIDTARMWKHLSNAERSRIINSEATVYDFITANFQ